MDIFPEQGVTIDRAAAAIADDVVDLDAMAGAALDLPKGAEQNADGTVTLTLDFPVSFKMAIGGGATKQENVAEMLLHRLSGVDMRKILAANGARMSQIALARSAKFMPSKMAVLAARMDASDLNAANAVVAALADFDADEGLPEHADEADGVITLPLKWPAEPEGFDPRHELLFHRLKGEDLIAIQQARDTLPTALARATRMTPKEANALFDAMDAADIMAANRVIGFLSGSGRRTGR